MVANYKSISPPDLTTVLEEFKKEVHLTLNCTQIGTVKEFDINTQLATIQLSLKQIESVDENGVKVLIDYPLLVECPVVVLFGGVDVLTMPITEGDSCLVFFNDRQIDNWLNFGDGQPPSIKRTHDLSDGIAIVGIRPLTNSIGNYLANGIRLSHGFGNSQIDLTDDLLSSIASLFLHTGDMRVTGDTQIDGELTVSGDATCEQDLAVDGGLTVLGTVTGNGGTITVDANIVQTAGKEIHAGNGATGTFTSVTVIDGIVTAGS